MIVRRLIPIICVGWLFAFAGGTAIAANRMEMFLFDYIPLHSQFDPTTGKYVEIGVYRTFSSAFVELALFDNDAQSRRRFDDRTTIFSSENVTEDVRLEIQDGCYTVIYEFDAGEFAAFVPQWPDPQSGTTLCFQIKSPDGSRTFNATMTRK